MSGIATNASYMEGILHESFRRHSFGTAEFKKLVEEIHASENGKGTTTVGPIDENNEKVIELVEDDDEDTTTIYDEIRLVLELAVPTVIIQLGSTVPSFITAAYIGLTFGSTYLSGYMLANLTGNLCTLTLLQGIFSASDTLSPQAFGAKNYPEVGLVAIRGFLLCIIVMIPIIGVLCVYMDNILLFFGEDSDASFYATHWYRIYALSLPFYALHSVTWKFCSAQSITRPAVVVVTMYSFFILPGLLFLFGSYFGFIGTAYAVATYIILQPLTILLYLSCAKPYHPETWTMPTWSTWGKVMQWKQLSTFITLGAGGILATSEWIYWESLSLMVGTIGVIELSVHTIPTQVITVAFMIPLGIGIAMAIRIGNVLPRSVEHAKHLCLIGFIASTIFFTGMTILTYVYRASIYRIFTSEPAVIAGCEEIWIQVSLYFFNLSMFGVNMGIATGLGQQWTLGMVTVFFLWILGLPASYYLAIVKGGGLIAAWDTVWPPYVAINLVLIFSFIRTDWHETAKQILIREGLHVVADETHSLLLATDNNGTYGSTTTIGASKEPKIEAVVF